jgi:hypothetical protein
LTVHLKSEAACLAPPRRFAVMTDPPHSQPPQWGPPSEGQPQPPGGGPPPRSAPAAKGKKHHRIFLWIFLAVQAIFLLWVILGASTNEDNPESCAELTGDALKLCQDAGDVGTAIGVGLIIGLWVAVDVILGISYGIYRLSRRPRS